MFKLEKTFACWLWNFHFSIFSECRSIKDEVQVIENNHISRSNEICKCKCRSIIKLAGALGRPLTYRKTIHPIHPKNLGIKFIKLINPHIYDTRTNSNKLSWTQTERHDDRNTERHNDTKTKKTERQKRWKDRCPCDIKRSVDLRWLFDHWCYVHLRWSCSSIKFNYPTLCSLLSSFSGHWTW